VAALVAINPLRAPSIELGIEQRWHPATALDDLFGFPTGVISDTRLYSYLDRLLRHKMKLEQHQAPTMAISHVTHLMARAWNPLHEMKALLDYFLPRSRSNGVLRVCEATHIRLAVTLLDSSYKEGGDAIQRDPVPTPPSPRASPVRRTKR
jgi:hypothetical protein